MASERLTPWKKKRTARGLPTEWSRSRDLGRGFSATVVLTFDPGSMWGGTVRGFWYRPRAILPETPFFKSGYQTIAGAKAAGTRWLRGLRLVERTDTSPTSAVPK